MKCSACGVTCGPSGVPCTRGFAGRGPTLCNACFLKRDEVVLEGHDRAPEPALQAPDLDQPRRDPIVRSPYLTAEEAAVYVRSATVRAFYKWRVAHGVPACRAGRYGKLLFRRGDLDEALKPAAERGRRLHLSAHRRRA